MKNDYLYDEYEYMLWCTSKLRVWLTENRSVNAVLWWKKLMWRGSWENIFKKTLIEDSLLLHRFGEKWSTPVYKSASEWI